MHNHHFIRIYGEIGWIYVLGFVGGQSAFINPLIRGDYTLYVNGHHEMRPITLEQYSFIYEALSKGHDPTSLIQTILSEEENLR